MKLPAMPTLMSVTSAALIAVTTTAMTAGIAPSFLSQGNAGEARAAAIEPCERTRSAFGMMSTNCTGSSRQYASGAKYDLGSLLTSRINTNASHAPVNSLDLLTGEKSVIAGYSKYMSIGVVELSDGSLAPDGTRVEFLKGDDRSKFAITRGGIAHKWFTAPNDAGYIEVSGRVGNITTIPNAVRIVPADPVAVRVAERVRKGRRSDDRQLWFNSDDLVDAYGNRITDGSFVQFAGHDELGRHMFLNTVAVNGIASTKYIQREMAGDLSLATQHKDIISLPVDFELKRILLSPELPIAGRIMGREVNLVIGPLTHSRGTYVADGFEVSIALPDGREYRDMTFDGMVEFQFALPQSIAEQEDGEKIEIRAGRHVWYLELQPDEQDMRSASARFGYLR